MVRLQDGGNLPFGGTVSVVFAVSFLLIFLMAAPV